VVRRAPRPASPAGEPGRPAATPATSSGATAADLPPTARRILAAAQEILAERGYAELTITAISQVSGVNRALVSYYFGGKAGLLAALVDTLFQDPEVGLVEEIRSTGGPERARHFLEWQRRVSRAERTNRMLYELLPHALRDPEVRARFAEEYRVYRAVDAGLLAAAPRELSEQELESLAAVTIAVVEGLGIQRALDPDGFDHEAAWRVWRDVVGSYLGLSRP
jgi:AcrR family transcriptional regulator